MTCEDALNEFIKYCRAELKAEVTLVNIKSTINNYLRAFNYINVEDIKPCSVTDYKIKLKEEGIGGSSSNTYMNRLKKFLDFLYEENYIDIDIGSKIKLIPKSKLKMQLGKKQYYDELGEPGRILTDEEKQLVLKSAKILFEDKPHIAIMIELFLVAGFRIGELLNLKFKNINFDAGTFRLIRSKNQYLQQFFLGRDDLLQRIKKHCEINNIKYPDDLLFATRNKKPYDKRYFGIILAKIFYAAGLKSGKKEGGFTSHDFRRTCATNFSDAGMPITELKELLGHKDIASTMRYVKNELSQDKKKDKAKYVAKGIYGES